ncbi:Anucleate primary sterigmata protein B [Fusarium oxysporum f. sp. albedinis]|nr:Anucleate primary sterigmata protein B [Fusarium oxysporum f. sp. albedinis]
MLEKSCFKPTGILGSSSSKMRSYASFCSSIDKRTWFSSAARVMTRCCRKTACACLKSLLGVSLAVLHFPHNRNAKSQVDLHLVRVLHVRHIRTACNCA